MRMSRTVIGAALAAAVMTTGVVSSASATAGRAHVSAVKKPNKPAKPGRSAVARFQAKLHLRAVAAAYLGLERAAIRLELRSGQSLGQIADATPDRSAAGLRAALMAAVEKRLDARVAAGRMTEARRAALLAAIAPRIDALINASRPAHAGHVRGDLRAVIEQYLGLDRAAIRAQFRDGKSLAEIADSIEGKSAAGLKDAILAAITTYLDEQVAAGNLTEERKARILEAAPARVDAMLARTGRPRGPGHRHGPAAG